MQPVLSIPSNLLAMIQICRVSILSYRKMTIFDHTGNEGHQDRVIINFPIVADKLNEFLFLPQQLSLSANSCGVLSGQRRTLTWH